MPPSPEGNPLAGYTLAQAWLQQMGLMTEEQWASEVQRQMKLLSHSERRRILEHLEAASSFIWVLHEVVSGIEEQAPPLLKVEK